MLGKQSPVVLSLLTLLISSTTYATNYKSPADYLNVTIANRKPGFEVYGGVIGLKPGATNLNYVIYNKELPTQSPTWTEMEIRPAYTGAFQLGARYTFCEARDINIDWTHLNSSTTTSVAALDTSHFLGPDYEIGPDSIPIRNASGNARFRYDVVNLDVGQYIDIGRRVQMRFFGGLSGGFLREQVTATYTGTVLTGAFPGPFSEEQNVVSNFTGVGPRFGIDGNYDMGCGFGLMGGAAVSALVGTSYAKTSFNNSSAELLALFDQSVNSQFIKDQTITQVIPAIDAKIGVNYNHTFKSGPMLTLSTGYQAAVYVNAINQYLPGSLVGDTTLTALDVGGIYIATMDHTISNYSVQGPFFKVAIAV